MLLPEVSRVMNVDYLLAAHNGKVQSSTTTAKVPSQHTFPKQETPESRAKPSYETRELSRMQRWLSEALIRDTLLDELQF